MKVTPSHDDTVNALRIIKGAVSNEPYQVIVI